MKITNRILAGILVIAVMLTIMSQTVQSDAPKVSTDEVMYANLDHYGKINSISIVKGCNLNGNNEFTDYGSYSKVANMSNFTTPIISGDSVTWKLPENTGRFYFECTPKDGTVILPWNFDISYKLNGVPADPKKLAGASGLVEINIKVTPNKEANDYYKNNMLLQAGALIDMSDNLSVEAPGAQLQSIGEKKVALFAALPGEETTFTIRIGTKKFETYGIIMMMIPATLEQMKDIKGLKEAKNTVEDSVDAINESTNEILKTIDSMSGGLKQVQSGLSSMDKARDTISSSKEGLYEDADKSLSDINAVAEQTAALIPHLQSAQSMVGDVNTDVNALVQTVSEAKSFLVSLRSSIKRVQNDANELRDILDDFDDSARDRRSLMSDMKKDIRDAEAGLNTLQKVLSSMNTSLRSLSDIIESLQPTLEFLAGSGDTNAALFAALFPSLEDTIDSTNNLINAVRTVCIQSDRYLETAEDTLKLADTYFEFLEDGADSSQDIIGDLNNAGDMTRGLLELGETLIDNVTALNNTMNQYKDETVSALKDTEDLMLKLTNALTSSRSFLSSFEAMMKAGSGNLDEGARSTLSGLIDVLEKGLMGISKTSVIRNANNTIKKTVDDEIDKYEEENNLLNIDAEAELVSFTSSKNPPPDSIQIVLRTEEISLDDNKNTIEDLEKAKEDVGFFKRMLNIFVKIWQSIVSAFSE